MGGLVRVGLKVMRINFVPPEITAGVQGLPCQHMDSQGKPCTTASLLITPGWDTALDL